MNTSEDRLEKDRFIVRFNQENMRQELKDRARRNMRTMNAEVLFLIDQGIKATDRNENAAH
jgi:hypothetical protein